MIACSAVHAPPAMPIFARFSPPPPAALSPRLTLHFSRYAALFDGAIRRRFAADILANMPMPERCHATIRLPGSMPRCVITKCAKRLCLPAMMRVNAAAWQIEPPPRAAMPALSMLARRPWS